MNIPTPTRPNDIEMEVLKSPTTLVRRFVTKRTRKSSLILGLVLGLYMISKTSTYVKTYSTVASREKIAESIGSNVGIEALLGRAHSIETVTGYMTWNFLCIITAVGAIWAIFIATKTFRGEEDTGRWELLLAGQTTARKAVQDGLVGLYSGIVLIFIFLALAIIAIGHLSGVHFAIQSGVFFALSLICGAIEFIAIGVLASQLMPVRSKAIGLSAGIFGAFYLLRLIADTSSASWLLTISPLGWIERLQPMYGSQPLWLIPIGVFTIVVGWLSVYFAGHRDLDEAILTDSGTARAHTALLHSPISAAIRLTWLSTLVWISVIVVLSFVYAQLAKGTIVNALGQSMKISHTFNRLSHLNQTKAITTGDFLGITFLLIMIIGMFFAANAISRIRDDEASGYLDNFLVQPYSRIRWLSGRAMYTSIVIVFTGILSGGVTWLAMVSQQSGISWHSLWQAGLNAIVPVLFIVGVGVCAMGLLPRLTSIIAYGAIAWSFLVIMLSSGLNLNHWLLDTSILHQISFAPASPPVWSTNAIIVLIAIGLGAIGLISFHRRDIQNE